MWGLGRNHRTLLSFWVDNDNKDWPIIICVNKWQWTARFKTEESAQYWKITPILSLPVEGNRVVENVIQTFSIIVGTIFVATIICSAPHPVGKFSDQQKCHMNPQTSHKLFCHLVADLEKPLPLLATPTLPYPWPDEEMMACYGLRYPTPAESNIFPTHRLVLNVFKVRITKIGKSPYINPEAGTGWVVWAVESYPGSHQFRMLNGDQLHEQYHEVEWEHAPDETPVTTPASAKRAQVQQQWQRKVRGGIRQSLRL